MLHLSAIDSDSEFGREKSEEAVGDVVLFPCAKLVVISELGDLAMAQLRCRTAISPLVTCQRITSQRPANRRTQIEGATI
jgi:hypothetical protein